MANTYPLPAYHFIVQWGGSQIGFSEVSGLDILVEVTEYREGSSKETDSIKMPARTRFSNIVLKRGIRKGDSEFFQWINTVTISQVERRDITIQLLDEQHQPVVTWKVHNAFPVRYSGPVLRAKSGEVAIEELELAHEGLSIVQ